MSKFYINASEKTLLNELKATPENNKIGYDYRTLEKGAKDSARYYHKSALLLLENSLKIPAYLNSALSCELYLKAICFKNNKPAHGHKLDVLYDGLVQYCPNFQASIDQLMTLEEKAEFPEFLKLNNDVFVTVRYFYENIILPFYLEGMLRFAEILEKCL